MKNLLPYQYFVRCMGTNLFLQRETTVYDFLWASMDNKALKMGSTFKWKNLLLVEQILTFKS